MKLRNRTALLASAGLLAVAGAGAAIGVAASGGGSPSEAFADALSARVGTEISAEQVEQARLDVARERLDQAVRDGRITQEQADQLLTRLENAPERHTRRSEAREAISDAVSGFLGLSPEELREQRQDGKSLAEVAEDQGKTRAGLLDVVKKAIRDGASAAGAGPLDDERVDAMAERIVDGTGHGPGHRGFRGGPRGGGFPGGFGGP